MVKRIVPGALALALTHTLVGCPGGKDPKPDSGELSLAAYCAEIPGLMNVIASCMHADPAVLGDTSVACAAIEVEVAAGRLTYRGDLARACVDAWKAATCDTVEAGVPECASGMLAGAAPNGSACLDDLECTNGHCRVEASCPGVCTAYVGVNGDCTAAGAKCAPDFYCSSGRCIALSTTSPAKQGEACATGDCASGLYCDPATKTCAPKRKSGSCKGAYDACALGYACVESGTCVVFSGRGEPCGPDASCGPGWACVDGTCGPAPAIGSPCAPSQRAGTNCTAGAYCDTSGTSSICRARKPGGAACADAMECQSYGCTAGRCEFDTCIQ